MTPTPDTTPIDHAPLSTTGENPVEKLLATLNTAVTPLQALEVTGQVLAGLTEAMPEEARERLSRLRDTITGYPDPKGAKEAEAASQRADAAHMRNRATGYELKAEALEALTPEEWVALKVTKDVEQAARSARRAEARHGAISVDITTEITETVLVEKEEMEAAGWHHESTCGAGEEAAAGVVAVDEAAALRNSTHHVLQDWHDRAHGLTSWANCPNEPCKLLPESAKAYRAGGAHS